VRHFLVPVQSSLFTEKNDFTLSCVCVVKRGKVMEASTSNPDPHLLPLVGRVPG